MHVAILAQVVCFTCLPCAVASSPWRSRRRLSCSRGGWRHRPEVPCRFGIAVWSPIGPWALPILPGSVPLGESFAAPFVALSPRLRCSVEGSTGCEFSVISFWLKLCHRGVDAIERRRRASDRPRPSPPGCRFGAQQRALGRTHMPLVGASIKQCEGLC